MGPGLFAICVGVKSKGVPQALGQSQTQKLCGLKEAKPERACNFSSWSSGSNTI